MIVNPTKNGSTTCEAIIDAGVELLKRGLPIVPCDGKDPGILGKGWHKQTVTEERIRSLLSKVKEPAIGVKLGPDAGFIDVEADGAEEEKLVAELFAGCEPPMTPTYTSRRGKHRLYRFDNRFTGTKAAVINFRHGSTAKLGCRVGADGKGAQSIIPPSRGREWLVSLDDCDPAQLPDLVVERLLAAVRPKPKASTGAAKGVNAKALQAISRISIEDDNDGSKRLFTAACRCVGHDLSENAALAAIREYERQRPFPKAYSDAEILRRVRDAEKEVERGSEITINNYEEVEIQNAEGETQTVCVPLSMGDIIEAIKRHTDNWPRRVGNVLFVDDQKHGLDWFDRRTTPALFGWLRRRCKVEWKAGGKLVSQPELFAELERTSHRYEAIELLPHEPPILNHYYRCKTPKPGDGTHFRWLLGRFRPETTIDRDLIQAAFMTPFWGGPVGCRPAFVITSDQGRGVGKTKLSELLAYPAGGFIDVSAGEDIATLKQRFLSPEGQTKRIAILDNVKTMRLSWAELESLITTPIISGKQMYVGEAQRPNVVTWLLTLNGVSLATDMAQRSVIIKLVKGENAGPWYEETIRYIDQHRDAIIGDIIAALRAEPYKLASYTRWASWEQAVLSRLPEPDEAQKVILERQGEANCEQDEAEIIEEFFGGQLAKLEYQPRTAQVRIPVAIAARWYGWAIGEPAKTAAASKRLRQMAAEGQVCRISPDSSRQYGRCFVWTGKNADIYSNSIQNDLAKRLAEKRESDRETA